MPAERHLWTQAESGDWSARVWRSSPWAGWDRVLGRVGVVQCHTLAGGRGRGPGRLARGRCGARLRVDRLATRSATRAILQESTEHAKILERRAYESGLCIQIIVNPPTRPHKPVVAVGTSVGLMRKPIKIYAVRWPEQCNAPPKPGAPGAGRPLIDGPQHAPNAGQRAASHDRMFVSSHCHTNCAPAGENVPVLRSTYDSPSTDVRGRPRTHTADLRSITRTWRACRRAVPARIPNQPTRLARLVSHGREEVRGGPTSLAGARDGGEQHRRRVTGGGQASRSSASSMSRSSAGVPNARDRPFTFRRDLPLTGHQYDHVRSERTPAPRRTSS